MIFLNIGSNLNSSIGDRFQNIQYSIDLLTKENIKVVKKSNFFETPSYPNKSNPKFINLSIEIEFDEGPQKLINLIKNIEAKLERKRLIKNEPRTCDIDIIDFNGLIKNQEDLILPHPKAFERNFVLFPLKEICPRWVHPLLNTKIDNLIEKLTPEARNEITRLNESVIL